MFRIGIGYDVHQFAVDRDLILGGIKIPYEKGLLGHSDADVLTHAIMDALLGALALGTIGDHFPDTDAKYKDVSSLILLENVMSLISEKGYGIQNIDAVISAQEPKLAPHMQNIRNSIAQHLKVEIGLVSVKATTTEKLGFEGRLEGMSCQSVVMLKRV